MLERNFWRGKKVLVTGHTGFKGSWLCLWLSLLGAEVVGYALKPPTKPSLFEICKIDKIIKSTIGDITDLVKLKKVFTAFKPEIVIHMAAQSLVRESYIDPCNTYSTNVIGTINLFEAVRACANIRAVINVTTDKCYKNDDRQKSFRENDALGGFDPYSSSKACSELVTSAYRSSFFNPDDYKKHRVAIASVRAGNVIGGGDWAKDRLIPDFVRAVLSGDKIYVRNPKAIRPWQHVFEPLSGYLILAEKLYKYGQKYGDAWNFGPDFKGTKNVEWIIRKLCGKWGKGAAYEINKGKHPHEAACLRLDCVKAQKKLGWRPSWDLETSLDKIIEWTKVYQKKDNLRQLSCSQIEEFMRAKKNE